MQRYLKNRESKLELSQEFTNLNPQDVVIYLDTFRSSMKGHFDDPMSAHLSEAAQKIKDVYIKLLEKFIEGQYYFTTKRDFRKIGSAMNIWRIPVSENYSSQWRHNEHNGVSNHQPHDCLLNRLFGFRSKKTPKLRVTGLCEGNSPVTGEFPPQRASNAENVSIWWRYHAGPCLILYIH